MNTARFWTIIGQSRTDFDPGLRDGNMDRQVERLQDILSDLVPTEIADFQREFDERMNQA